MSERQRWLESDEIDDDVRDLLRAAPRPRAMKAAERARSARTLGRIAALPAAAGLMFWVKNVALAGVLGLASGAVVSGAVILVTDDEPKAATTSAAPVAPMSTPIVTPRAELDRKPASAPTAEPKAKRVPAAPLPSVEPADSLASEARKLEDARRALAGNPARALELLSEHAREFPSGKLSAERELLAIDALSRLGRKSEARARAEAMLARSRGGLYEERLKKMLSTMP